MRLRYALALCVLALLAPAAVAGSGPASAAVPDRAAAGTTHGDHVSVDAQATADGRVVVETVSAVGPSFVVLRRDDGGRPGEPVGHASVPASTFRTDVAVDVDESVWANWSGGRLWAVLHRDDGDGTFEPGDDSSMASRSPAAEASFALARTDGGADRVLARVFGSRRLDDGSLTVRRVDLSRSGFVVATSIGGDRVVGTRALDAGTHRNVTVALNESFLADQRRDFRVRLVAYRDDGNGRFDDGDRPVTVGEEPVATTLVVEQSAGDGTVTTRPLVVTPTPGTTTGAVPTTGSPTPTASAPPTGTATGPPDTATDPTSASGPGFGVLVALAASFAVAALLAVVGYVRTGRRRR